MIFSTIFSIFAGKKNILYLKPHAIPTQNPPIFDLIPAQGNPPSPRQTAPPTPRQTAPPTLAAKVNFRKPPADRLMIENAKLQELIEKQACADIIINFERFAAICESKFKELGSRIDLTKWTLHKHSRCVAFFKLSYGLEFKDVSINTKIVINHQILVSIYNQENLIRHSKIQFIFDERRIRRWSQFENMFQDFGESSVAIENKHSIAKAVDILSKVY